MAERQIQARKSQMFLHSVIPVINTHDQVVKQKLEAGKFPFTITGMVKIIAFLFLLTSISVFVGSSKCTSAPQWYPYLLLTTLGITMIFSFALYLIFSFGCTINSPGKWVKIDIFSNLVLSVATIIVSIVTMTSCNSNSSLFKIPGILGLCGGGVLIMSCAAIFLLYRYKEEDYDNEDFRQQTAYADARRSIFA